MRNGSADQFDGIRPRSGQRRVFSGRPQGQNINDDGEQPLQALEDRLGARLLHRTTRKVSLTEVGKAYCDRCTQILGDLEQADEIAGALQSAPRGTLRIYTATHIVPFIAPVVAAFLASYPDVNVNLTMGERTIDLSGEGFDLALRWRRRPIPALSSAPWRPGGTCCAVHLPILKNTDRRSNCPNSQNEIALAIYSFRMGTTGTSSTGKARRRRCGSPAIWSSIAARRYGQPLCEASVFRWRRDFGRRGFRTRPSGSSIAPIPAGGILDERGLSCH